MPGLKGRKVLVTGAARRLGRGITGRLAKEGCDIVIHYGESAAEARQLAEEVQEAGVHSWLIQRKLESEDSCKSLISDAVDSAGGLDFLVNNASVFPPGDIRTATAEEFERALTVNSFAPLWLSNSFASNVSSGAIVNMLDARISGYDFSNFPYYVSKRVLYDMTGNLALRYSPRVRVNGVAPGLVLPPEGKDASYLERISRSIPLRKHGTAGDVAEAVLFLLKSDFVTGQTIFVDGGQHLLHHIFGKLKDDP